MKLLKYMFKASDICPINMIYLMCFNEHSYRFISVIHKSDIYIKYLEKDQLMCQKLIDKIKNIEVTESLKLREIISLRG